jgi:hypothetical protein
MQMKLISNGDYPNLSKFIRVEVDSGVSNKTNDKTLVPFGFRSLTSVQYQWHLVH